MICVSKQPKIHQIPKRQELNAYSCAAIRFRDFGYFQARLQRVFDRSFMEKKREETNLDGHTS